LINKLNETKLQLAGGDSAIAQGVFFHPGTINIASSTRYLPFRRFDKKEIAFKL